MDKFAPGARAADVLLSDGTVAVIRPLRVDDREQVDLLHRGLSTESSRLRFFTLGRRAGPQYVEHLFAHRDDTIDALVAEADGHLVALATAELISAVMAEVAFLVSDELHGHGVGSLLLEHLAASGRARGLTTFVAEVLPENAAMLRVFLDAGFTVAEHLEEGVVHVELDIAASDAALSAADLREAEAEARSLQPLLSPRTVALVGARREPSGIGRAVLEAIREGGFSGTMHVVHPHASEIDGVPTYPRLVDIPGHVDLVIVTVPAEHVIDAVRDAADARVGAVVVISSGFSELGERGSLLQKEIAHIARSNSLRLVGPNCLGVLCHSRRTQLNATFSRSVPPAGGLAIASQSGGVGIALLDLAVRSSLGVHSFISLGNKADVSSNDLLAAWSVDDEVTAAALYLESFGNAVKFARVARRFAESKPLLAVVGGRSAGGRRAGASHTAAAATPAVGVDALFAQAGVIACATAEEIMETARLLAEQPYPQGRRVAVVSNAGGMGVLVADLAEPAGLVVPELSDALQETMGEVVIGTVGTGNPIDLGAGATPGQVERCLVTLMSSDEVDTVLLVLVATSMTEPDELLAALASARATHPGKPLVVVPMGGLTLEPGRLEGVTAYAAPAPAVAALGRVTRYAEWRSVPREPHEPADGVRALRASGLARQALARRGPGGGWLDPVETEALLGAYGVTPVGRSTDNAVEAAHIAERIGFPVAVKVVNEDVQHKTDRGLVRVGLQTAAEVIAAVRSFEVELPGETVRVAVQPVLAGVEIAVGVVRDPGFGALVMVAAGGIATELFADRVFLVPPLTRRDTARAVRSLRTWPLLDGYRGAPAVDVNALEQLIVGVGHLAADVPEVAELDLNPVLVSPDGVACVDLRVRLAPAPEVDAGVPRRLRSLR